jgi:hypothetical protein
LASEADYRTRNRHSVVRFTRFARAASAIGMRRARDQQPQMLDLASCLGEPFTEIAQVSSGKPGAGYATESMISVYASLVQLARGELEVE